MKDWKKRLQYNTLALKKRITGDYKYIQPSNPMTDIYYYVNTI